MARQAPLASFLALAIACGGSQTDVTPMPSQGVEDVPPIAPPPSALTTITSAELRAHVEMLASDDFGGRETLTEGAEKAASYIAAAFESYGLSPLPGKESFRVPYRLDRYKHTADKNDVAISVKGKGTGKLVLGADFAPFDFSDAGRVENVPVVFAGYGITAPDLGWDDYKGLSVKGKVVLVLRHFPGEEDKESVFAGTNHPSFTAKALNAQNHGAVAMLLVTDPLHHEAASDDFTSSGFVRMPASDEEKAEAEARRAEMAKVAVNTPKLFAAHISQAAAATIIATQKKYPDLSAIQAAIDAGTLQAKSVALRAKATVEVTEPTEPIGVFPENVIGYLEGSDPVLKNELVVVGGHYDHLGHGAGGSEADVIYNGADDNASGTAGVLELAQAFASLSVRPKRSLVFVAFSGEEKGLLGSFSMMREEQLREAQIAFMLNLDMIGRNPDKPLDVLGEAYATTIREVVDAANKEVGLDIRYVGTNYAGNSDHHAFFVRDIPMMFFFTGLHDDYHQVSDHANLVEFGRMEKIVRLGYGVIDGVAQAGVRPSFIHNFSWLGARVEIVGAGDAARATFTQIDDGSRGTKAGLASGDIIDAIDGVALDDPTRVGARFREVKPGAVVKLSIQRGSDVKEIEVVRAKRGFLGIFPGQVSDEARKQHGLGEDEGVLIRGMTSGGPAEKAGFKEDDILIRIAGIPVSGATLGEALARIGAGEEVAIVVIRGADRLDLTMVLGER